MSTWAYSYICVHTHPSTALYRHHCTCFLLSCTESKALSLSLLCDKSRRNKCWRTKPTCRHTWAAEGVTEHIWSFHAVFVLTAALKFCCFVHLSPWTMNRSCDCLDHVCQRGGFCACVQKRRGPWRRAGSLLQHMVPRLNNKMNVSWIRLGTETPPNLPMRLNSKKTRMPSWNKCIWKKIAELQ